MATYEFGPLGPFRGKLGTVIGSSWKGKPYMRSLPGKITKEPTQKKKNAQSAFSFVSKWLAPINELVMIGFHHYDLSKTGRMSAHSYNSLNALIKSSEGFSIDYSKALFSYGTLPGALTMDAKLTEDDTVLIIWSTETLEEARPSDVLMYLVYFPDKRKADYAIGEHSRKDGKMLFKVPAENRGQRMEIMIAFKSVIDNNVSTSQYLGAISFNQEVVISENAEYCLPLSVESILGRLKRIT